MDSVIVFEDFENESCVGPVGAKLFHFVEFPLVENFLREVGFMVKAGPREIEEIGRLNDGYFQNKEVVISQNQFWNVVVKNFVNAVIVETLVAFPFDLKRSRPMKCLDSCSDRGREDDTILAEAE